LARGRLAGCLKQPESRKSRSQSGRSKSLPKIPAQHHCYNDGRILPKHFDKGQSWPGVY
jgi:hypothetical protein